MTNREAIHILRLLKKYYKDYFDTEDNEALDMAIEALEEQPSEDEEVIKVSKGAVKARQGRFVIYDVEWLKKNFYATEEKIYGQPKETCEDCISRKAELDGLASIAKAKAKSDAQKALMGRVMYFTEQLPPVTPKYTDEEIDRAQAVEQAYIDKMVELRVEELKRPKAQWIPIKTRPMTEEEKEEIGHEYDFMYDCSLPDDGQDVLIADCSLPDDGQDVLITDCYGNVEVDTFCRDHEGVYFETNCDEVVAWMPLPEPYKESEE